MKKENDDNSMKTEESFQIEEEGRGVSMEKERQVEYGEARSGKPSLVEGVTRTWTEGWTESWTESVTESGEDYSDDENEAQDEYRPGGYHVVNIGDIFNQR